MSLTLALLALTATQTGVAATVEPETEADIVVLARRLGNWRGRTRERNGELDADQSGRAVIGMSIKLAVVP